MEFHSPSSFECSTDIKHEKFTVNTARAMTAMRFEAEINLFRPRERRCARISLFIFRANLFFIYTRTQNLYTESISSL